MLGGRGRLGAVRGGLLYAGSMSGSVEEHAALVALLRELPKGERWSTVTELVLTRGSARAVWDDETSGTLISYPSRDTLLDQALQDVASWAAAGWLLLGILDAEYPARLREIHQAPPFLFAVGTLLADDPAVAVVGSRKASPRGLKTAAEIATALAGEGITVLSGLAAGIDTSAHTSALAAGGRTVAIIGSGITAYYPPANKDLQDEIARRGLVLSQFWPHSPPLPHNFLMRNAVMSGYGRATVVVEAGERSGARAQARMAVEHGRPVILTAQVVASNEWAQRLDGRPGVYTAASAGEVMEHVHHVLERDSQVDHLVDDILANGQ